METTTTRKFDTNSKRFEMMARAAVRQIRAILAKISQAQIYAAKSDGEFVRVVDAKSRGGFTFVRRLDNGEWFACASFEVRGTN
jgi:hypothetical protein